MITFAGPRCTALSPLPITHLRKLLAIRRQVPPTALGNPRMGLVGLVLWYVTVHFRSKWARAIYADGRMIGYVGVNRHSDLSILIGPPHERGHGTGTWAMHSAIRGARRAGVEVLTCGTTIPRWFERFGFAAVGLPVLDKGVWRWPMSMRLVP